ncbi:MAG: hypothetical protein PQ612_04135 [Rickettsiales bacterium]|nr:hypothetical protein [Pseudomonadota bacterium]MDA0966196.1 hypothetical protein [Pseudomonadota bacterium]MDG4543139.1 hypothetical protein [Rickettsiales bacterium]MDG4545337.1 hypothetical protein [Rickettsiales bacterium]MDG4547786.1 hypothetical protein [Rickettsiales bacterium]
MQSDADNQYIIEFVRVGDSVKVSAIDPKTGTETCIVAPVKGVTQKQMQDLAIQKLEYVLRKKG